MKVKFGRTWMKKGKAKETQWEERCRAILDRFIKTKNAKKYTAAKRVQVKGEGFDGRRGQASLLFALYESLVNSNNYFRPL